MNGLRIKFLVDTLTSIDIQEIVKIGGKIFRVYDGVIYRENFETPPLRVSIENCLIYDKI